MDQSQPSVELLSTNQSPFTCPTCLHTFGRMSNLKRHAETRKTLCGVGKRANHYNLRDAETGPVRTCSKSEIQARRKEHRITYQRDYYQRHKASLKRKARARARAPRRRLGTTTELEKDTYARRRSFRRMIRIVYRQYSETEIQQLARKFSSATNASQKRLTRLTKEDRVILQEILPTMDAWFGHDADFWDTEAKVFAPEYQELEDSDGEPWEEIDHAVFVALATGS